MDEHARMTIDGVAYEVLLVAGEEALSTPFRYEVTAVLRADAPRTASLLGRAASLTLRDAHGGERAVRGVVAEAASHVSTERAVLVVAVRPSCHRLSLGRDSRVFHDATAVEIVRRVLERGGVEARWEIARDYPKRVY